MIIIESVEPFKYDTGVPYYNDTMSNRPLNGSENYSTADYYKFEKGVQSEIQYMTATEYMDKCSNLVFNNDSYKGVDYSKVNKYADLIRNGTKFPLPYLNLSYDNETQEGRHRMLAAAKVYGDNEKFPVLVVTDSDPTEDEIWEYAKKKSPEHSDWMYDIIKANFSEEMDDYSDELISEEIDAIDIDEGYIIDAGDGLCIIDNYILRDNNKIDIQCTPISDNDSDHLYYILNDEDKVSYYPMSSNPQLYN